MPLPSASRPTLNVTSSSNVRGSPAATARRARLRRDGGTDRQPRSETTGRAAVLGPAYVGGPAAGSSARRSQRQRDLHAGYRSGSGESLFGDAGDLPVVSCWWRRHACVFIGSRRFRCSTCSPALVTIRVKVAPNEPVLSTPIARRCRAHASRSAALGGRHHWPRTLDGPVVDRLQSITPARNCIQIKPRWGRGRSTACAAHRASAVRTVVPRGKRSPIRAAAGPCGPTP